MTPSLKPQYGWSIAAYLPITPPVGELALRLRISADTVSIASLLVFWLGLVVYVWNTESLAHRLAAVICFALGTLLDVVDGYVARRAGSAGARGAIVDATIDLVRYNSLFVVLVWLEGITWTSAGIAAYGGLVSLSLFKTIHAALTGSPKRKLANEALGKFLPQRYVKFCLRNRLLFNPLNLEDQLNVAVLTVGTLLGCEVEVILVCLAIRVAEIAFGKIYQVNR